MVFNGKVLPTLASFAKQAITVRISSSLDALDADKDNKSLSTSHFLQIKN